jgi:hypothetical protein
VSDIRAWIDARRAAAPMDLGRWLHADAESGSMTERITLLARTALDEACSRPGRVRESAFQLLAADALVTYACEAALEEADPPAALRTILLRTVSER